MTKKNEDLIFAAVAIVVIAFLTVATANATGTKPPPQQAQQQDQAQDQEQLQDQDQVQTQDQHQSAASAANNEGNSLSVESNYESGPADLILVPNNNTENCLRVFGFSFGNRDGSGMLGIPFRSKACDYEQAADDAFAAGERDLGWFWKCHNKSLYKAFRDKGESRDAAIGQCMERMSQSTVTDLQERLTAAEERIVFLKSHEKVCEDSLVRCEKKAYGGK